MSVEDGQGITPWWIDWFSLSLTSLAGCFVWFINIDLGYQFDMICIDCCEKPSKKLGFLWENPYMSGDIQEPLGTLSKIKTVRLVFDMLKKIHKSTGSILGLT